MFLNEIALIRRFRNQNTTRKLRRQIKKFPESPSQVALFLIVIVIPETSQFVLAQGRNFTQGEAFSMQRSLQFTDLRRILLIIIYLPGDRSNYTVRRSAYILDNYSMHILTIRRLAL